MPIRPSRQAWRLVLCAPIAACAFAGGCAGLGFGGSSSVRVESLSDNTYLAPQYVTQIYASESDQSANIVISDVPIDDLRAIGSEDATVTGSILHLHMFLTPKAGKTPIEFSANNCAATLIVLAGGEVGVYRGGGFLLPSNDPGGSHMAGRVAQVTLRPGGGSPGFTDLLGHAELEGRVSARRDDPLTATVVSWIADVAARY